MTPDQYKRLRKKIGTQAEAATKLGVTRETINKREAGSMLITTEAAAALSQLSKRKTRKPKTVEQTESFTAALKQLSTRASKRK